ncbi:hypothetical protein C1I98_02645 [Spongiactinospora gelatinilytica]|uniref:Plasmid maintenance system killer protein n=1 Tax=Spongiactinospora gelatinilytica TaxID=2666298 RepID=A0A2W2HL23_9ACTN|nr:hypothetical protein [Spongiactinospora gelatinilytica]PZG55779.1 hypothetical protein C1I98_02645 [Spongiactinospora gelatinilytica]
MSPKRGDRVTVPPPEDEWDVRFGTGDAARGREELCRHALANTRRCFEILRVDPRSGAGHDRQHRLRGDLASHRHNGKDLEQWEFEVTNGGRVRYAIDDTTRTVWVIYASPRHPKDTE